jgi:molecular chaperone DnaJ
MHIQVTVEIPQNLTRRQRELLEAFETEAESEEDARTNPEHHSFFGKVREFFEGGRE